MGTDKLHNCTLGWTVVDEIFSGKWRSGLSCLWALVSQNIFFLNFYLKIFARKISFKTNENFRKSAKLECTKFR